MRRGLFVFGNGLGMSLDSEDYSLANAINSVWSCSDSMSFEQKELIVSAIPGTTLDKPPIAESQLEQLHMALAGLEYLKSIENEKAKWLNESSRLVPEAFRRFIHEVACHFHTLDQSLPQVFTTAVADFITKTNSHVATLNYDPLLYDSLKAMGLLQGYSGLLLDGFTNSGFSSDNLDRFKPKSKSWYMHLHGSPLFVGNKKIMGCGRDSISPDANSHIILAHVKHKPILIEGSDVLSEYWRRFNISISESDFVVLFGYSGEDEHVNEAISSRSNSKEIFVIEWSGNKTDKRDTYWREKFKGKNVTIFYEENILSFNNWDNLLIKNSN